MSEYFIKQKNKYLSFFLLIFLFVTAPNTLKADGWLKVESENFIFYSENSEAVTKDYLEALEKYHYYLGAFIPINKTEVGKGNKFVVYFLKDSSSYKKVWPDIDSNVGGFVSTCIDGMQAFTAFDGNRIDKNKKLKYQDENHSLIVLNHEYAHQFMLRNASDGYPKWFSEGFAEYYSTMRFSDTEDVLLGVPTIGRYANLLDYTYSYEEIIREDDKEYSDDKEAALYAQYWVLTHYLLSNEKFRSKLEAYFEKRPLAKDKVQLFEEIFEMKVKDLNKILDKYLDRDAKMVNYKIKPLKDIKYTIEKMPISAKNLILYDAFLKRCTDIDTKKSAHQKIINEANKYNNDLYAQRILMKSNLEIGEYEIAYKYFKSNSELYPNDAENWHLFGKSLFRAAHNNKFFEKMTKREQMKAARNAFFKSYNIQPQNSVNLYYLSLTAENQNKPDASSTNAAIEAYLLEPAIVPYAFNAIFFEIATDQFEFAKHDIKSLMSRTHANFDNELLQEAIKAIDEKNQRK